MLPVVALSGRSMKPAGKTPPVRVTGVKIDANGTIVVLTDLGAPQGVANPLDRLLGNGSTP